MASSLERQVALAGAVGFVDEYDDAAGGIDSVAGLRCMADGRT